eukprot:552148-Hanusia_phi.AAC.2
MIPTRLYRSGSSLLPWGGRGSSDRVSEKGWDKRVGQRGAVQEAVLPEGSFHHPPRRAGALLAHHTVAPSDERAPHPCDRQVDRLVVGPAVDGLRVLALGGDPLGHGANPKAALQPAQAAPSAQLRLQLLQEPLEELRRVVLQLDRLVHADVPAGLHEVDRVKAAQLAVEHEIHRPLHLPQHLPLRHPLLLLLRPLPRRTHGARVVLLLVLQRAHVTRPSGDRNHGDSLPVSPAALLLRQPHSRV